VAYAKEMEWLAQPYSFSAPSADLLDEVRECPKIEGLVLTPHFACEPVPLLFLDNGGEMVDLPLRGDPGKRIQLDGEIMVKTMFAGPTVHQEVVGLLDAVQDLITNFSVDDEETAYFESRDEQRLQTAFAAAYEGLGRYVAKMGLSPGDPINIGGMDIEVPEHSANQGEFESVDEETRDLVVQLEHGLLAMGVMPWDATGEASGGAPPGSDDLDLMVDIMQEDELLSGPPDQVDPIFHALGAAFGRHLVRRFGGHWVRDEENELKLRNVGGVGIIVDPFQVTADRIQGGAAFALDAYCDLCARVSTSLQQAEWRGGRS
jgi:hypothetical protein